jgi:type II secretory pathway pseudopilin PulG
MTHQSFQDKVRTRRITREVFVNDDGAIDLASIMVGIIVIGLIGAIIAATIFAVIPWAQDNAAKQQLDSVKSAEDAYRGLAEDKGESKYGNNVQLADPNENGDKSDALLDIDKSRVFITTTPAPHPTYTATIKSASGKTFTMTNGGKPTEVKDDGGQPSTPPAGASAATITGQAYASNSSIFSSLPSDKDKAIIAQKSPFLDADYQKLIAMVDKNNTDTSSELAIADGQKQVHSNAYGADFYIVRPNSVSVSADGKQLAQYSGATGSYVLIGTMSGGNIWQSETAVPKSIDDSVQNANYYTVIYTFDNFTLTFKGGPQGYTETGPTGNGTSVSTPNGLQFDASMFPYREEDGKGFETQEELDNAMNNPVTRNWAFKLTSNNVSASVLPDLSDLSFAANPDETLTTKLQDGRSFTDTALFVKTKDGTSYPVIGNYDMAPSGTTNDLDYKNQIKITMDSNKKVTSMQLDYVAVQFSTAKTYAEAQQALSGATIEVHASEENYANPGEPGAHQKTFVFIVK